MLLFGPLSDLAGWRRCEIDAPSISMLRLELARREPALAEALGRPGVQVALDQVITRTDAALAAGSELAFLPPMSGG